MAQLLVRNVDEAVIQALRSRAKAHGRSTEAEHRALLEGILLERSQRNSAFAVKSAELRKRISLPIDSLEIIREGRDSRR